MNYYSFDNIPFELLINYFEGSVSIDQKQQIDNWLESDPKNKDLYKVIKKVWIEGIRDIHTLNKETTEQDLNIILARIQEAEDKKKKKSFLNSHNTWIRAAAIIIIIVSVPLFYFLGKLYKQDNVTYQEKYTEVAVPRGQRSEITLSDGTYVWINADSKINFATHFGDLTRDIWLKGEAYFEVAKNESVPFRVHAGDLILKVYGTSFNIKAYPEEDLIETTLIEGSLSITQDRTNVKPIDEINLLPNNRLIYSKNESKFITSDIIDARSLISWREGKLTFENETFENIIVQLDRKYDIRIIINDSDQEIQKTKYTGVLKDISIEQVLSAIQRSMPINYSIKEDTVIITKKP